MRQEKVPVDDPQVRLAVLDLFKANDAFRAAYFDGAPLTKLEEAQRRIDEARERVSFIQELRH